jgi:sialate O-acetylesterase
MNTAPTPVDDMQGKWSAASPATAGAFSAIAYFFGKRLQHDLGVPIGLVNSSVGGTVVVAWTSSEALDADPLLRAGKDKAQKEAADFDHYVAAYQAWQKQFNREDHPAAKPEEFAGPKVDTSDWKPVTLPGLFAPAGLPDAGAVWVRRTVTVPPEQANHGLDMFLGRVQDSCTVYWNGRQVGSSDITAVEHRYGIRFNFVAAGESILAIRIFNPARGAGIAPGEPRFTASGIKLTGTWLGKPELALPPMSPEAENALPVRPPTPQNKQNVACYLYNGMIHPLIPYTLRGVIWYQGEAEWNRGFQYRTAFPLLINDWRKQWASPDLPFYFCQIANCGARPINPGNDGQAEVREAQTMALSLPHTGQAVLIDLGEEANIHPAAKKEAADRLAVIALAQTYRKTDIAGRAHVCASVT